MKFQESVDSDWEHVVTVCKATPIRVVTHAHKKKKAKKKKKKNHLVCVCVHD